MVADDLRAMDVVPHGVKVRLQQVEFAEVAAGFEQEGLGGEVEQGAL